MKLIGLCGKKASGKNFVADRIELLVNARAEAEYVNCRVEKAAFADPIKSFATDVLGIRRELLYGSDAQKNTKTQYLWGRMPQFVMDRNRGKSGHMTVREVMQVFGTEFIRVCWGDNVWTNVMKRRIVQSTAGYFVVTDVRFQEEADTIRELGGEVWMVMGPGSDAVDSHSSEDVEKVVVDRTIENDYLHPKVVCMGSVLYDDLSEQIKSALGLGR
jgi:hypothetical protein